MLRRCCRTLRQTSAKRLQEWTSGSGTRNAIPSLPSNKENQHGQR